MYLKASLICRINQNWSLKPMVQTTCIRWSQTCREREREREFTCWGIDSSPIQKHTNDELLIPVRESRIYCFFVSFWIYLACNEMCVCFLSLSTNVDLCFHLSASCWSKCAKAWGKHDLTCCGWAANCKWPYGLIVILQEEHITVLQCGLIYLLPVYAPICLTWMVLCSPQGINWTCYYYVLTHCAKTAVKRSTG